MALADYYSEYNSSLFSDDYGDAQSFTAIDGILSSSKFFVNPMGTNTGNIYSKLYDISGTFGTTSKPTGSPLAVSDPIDASTLSPGFYLLEFTFSGSNRITLTNGNHYAISIEYGRGGSGVVAFGLDFSSVTHPGNNSYMDGSGTWYAEPTYDLIFYVYEEIQHNLVVNALSYISTLKDTLLKFLGWTRDVKPTSTWTNNTKPKSTWTNNIKPSSTWTGDTKPTSIWTEDNKPNSTWTNETK